MREIQAVTHGWWFNGGGTRGIPARAAATYHPRFPMVYNPAQPFWLGVFEGWDFPRDWIHRALDGEPVGLVECGGVRIAREVADLRFDLRAAASSGVLWLPAGAVAAFLARTELLVPFGSEGDRVDWDGLTKGSAA